MKHKLQKRYQRHLNKAVRDINRNVYDDELWKGRFFARQITCYFSEYEDHSGGELLARIRFYDKKTKIMVDKNIEYSTWRFWSYRLWESMNEFITEDVSIWQNEDPRLGETEDYRGITVTFPNDTYEAKLSPIEIPLF